jgi:outer membrane lipoprotein LolB
MLKHILKSQLFSLIIFLAGCASVATTTTPTSTLTGTNYSWAQRETQLSAIRSWNLQGAMSIRQNGQVTLASISWQQQGRSFNQTLSGPFSLGGVRISGYPGRVTLWRSATDQITAPSPEALLQQEFGWSVPISNMYYWVRGLPVPGISAEKRFDSQQHLIAMQQEGWSIQYPSYRTVNGIDLPTTVLINNSQLQTKLVINRWTI